MAFNIALSGLNAAMSDLDVIGHNIANASTTGFKSSRAEFVDLLASAGFVVSNLDPGDGVTLAAVRQQFSQGNITFTGNALDLAIGGQGFFSARDLNGAMTFTRAGAFGMDREGYVVTTSGARLQAFDVIDPAIPTFNSAGTVDLQLKSTEGPPEPTTRADIGINLQADAENLGAGAIDPADPDSYNYSTSFTIYDSLGVAHSASVYFRRTDNLQWDSTLVIDGDTAQTTTTNQLTFDAAGNLTSANPLSFGTFTPTNGADPINLNVDLSNATSFGSSFTVTSLSQDGFPAGRLSNLDIDDSGVVFARFSNGQSEPLGKIALAKFQNAQGLKAIGDTSWVESFASGQAVFGQPGGSGLGLIQSGSLESSNVNLSQELVNLIGAQRNFQASAQVISTADTLNQTLLNIR